MIKVTLIKSASNEIKTVKATVEALGLKKLHQTVTVEDNPAMRGMIRTVSHLVTVTEA